MACMCVWWVRSLGEHSVDCIYLVVCACVCMCASWVGSPGEYSVVCISRGVSMRMWSRGDHLNYRCQFQITQLF